MAKQTIWYNDDGLAVVSGPRTATTDIGSVGSGIGAQEELIFIVSDGAKLADETDASLEATGGIYAAGSFANAAVIPAHSTINSAYFLVETAFASDTAGDDINIGVWRIDETTGLLSDTNNSPNGIIGDTNGDIDTNLSTAGNVITATGSLVGFSSGAYDHVVVAIFNGTGPITAGRAQVVIRYTSSL